ncbi:MAG: ribonuclease P [Candidatus Marsarchaeota archaeon]|jgi:RNase P subunit RPR2|nr:ribonuclease P [Candidatus Marsarchaeota archaeon]MCL5418749.1 ribonuclease P [Candidatus Marsarchaeota archaeon]
MPKDHKELVRGIAEERIAILFDLAKKSTIENTGISRNLARSYVKKILLISMHYKVKLPKRVKDSICARCNTVLIPGLNAHVRLASSHSYIALKCDNCGYEKHIFYKGRSLP